MPKTRKYNFNMESTPLLPEKYKKLDATILVTDHDSINYKQLQDHSKLIIDTRGRYKESKNIWRA